MGDESAPRPPLVLTKEQAIAVRDIIERVVPGADVRVFGSRATGRARPHSDLDLLLLHPRRLTWVQRADLRDFFEASALPFRVDVVEAECLAPGMASRVMGESVPLGVGAEPAVVRPTPFRAAR